MIKTTFLFTAAFLSLSVVFPVSIAYADDDVEQIEQVEHYHVDAPADAVAAKNLLDKTVEKIGRILAEDGELGEAKLERIHEASYSLEASVDALRADGSYPNEEIDALDESVQALHFASEQVEAEKAVEWFGILKVQASALLSQDEAAAPVQEPEKREFYEISIKDHKFDPVELHVPAGDKIKLKVHNQDPTPEEFESHDMNREKVIAGGKTATIFIGPLKPGKYHYFGEFNMDTANGYIIAE